MINFQKPVAVSNVGFLDYKDIPCWAICYLEYGDEEGLNPDDFPLVRQFKRNWILVERKSEESFYSTSPEFGLPSEVETWACLPILLSDFVSYAFLNQRIGVNGHVVYYSRQENGAWKIIHSIAPVSLDGRKSVGVCVNEVLERIRLAKDEHVNGFVIRSHNTTLFKSNKNIA